MNNERWLDVLLAPVVLALVLWTQGTCAAEVERWHVMNIDGTTVGSVHERERLAGERRIVSEEVVLVLNRMGSRIEMRTFQETSENLDGELEAVRLETKASEQVMSLDARREGDDWVTRTHIEGVPEQRTPLEAPLAGPGAIRALLASLAAPGESVEYHGFIAHLGRPGKVRAEHVGYEEFGGQRLKVVEETLPGMPAPLTRLFDETGHSVVTRIPGPFGITETVLADETAARLADAGGELGEEVYRATLLETGVRLPAPREIEYLELELNHRNPALGWPELDNPNQQVLERSPERLVLAVHRRHPRQSAMRGDPVAAPLVPYLQANALLQVNQPELVALAHEIVADERDAWRAARKLERWVADNMAFDMGVVLAPSNEVLANRRGTCTEYAVLLTALARAAGVPARFVMGYVYAHGMFGGHAWSEVLIGEDWLALDAAIPADGPADAARFAFVWSDLDGGPGELSSGAAMQLYGQIGGRVLAWKHADGAEHRYPDGAPAPRVIDGRFVDRVTGIEWAVPEGWRIVDYTETWPSNRIAAAEHVDGHRVDLHWLTLNPWENAGDQGSRRPVDGRVVMSWPGRGGYWRLESDAGDHLERLAAGLILPAP